MSKLLEIAKMNEKRINTRFAIKICRALYHADGECKEITK